MNTLAMVLLQADLTHRQNVTPYSCALPMITIRGLLVRPAVLWLQEAVRDVPVHFVLKFPQSYPLGRPMCLLYHRMPLEGNQQLLQLKPPHVPALELPLYDGIYDPDDPDEHSCSCSWCSGYTVRDVLLRVKGAHAGTLARWCHSRTRHAGTLLGAMHISCWDATILQRLPPHATCQGS
jgi:hypothetical protein